MYAGIHHYSILHDIRELMIVGREWYRPSAAGPCSCARLHRDYTSYTTKFSIAARPYTSPVCGHTAPKELVAVAVSVAGQLQTPPPSIERSFQVYLTQRTVQLKLRHSNSNAIPKCRSGRPDIRSFSLVTPATPTRNLPPHSHSSYRRQFLRLAQRRPVRQATTWTRTTSVRFTLRLTYPVLEGRL